MFIKQLQQFVNLLFNCKMSMIVSPHIFSQIKRQSYSTDTTFSSKPSFKVSPESLKAIYMIALFIAILAFAMFYQTMDITFRSNASVTFPSIRTNGRTLYRSFERSSASSGLDFPLVLAFILPLAAYAGLINFNRSVKDRRDIARHNQTHFSQSTQDTPTINPCFIADTRAADASQKPLQNSDPLFTAQMKRQSVGIPLIFTSSASPFSSLDSVDYFKRTFWANFYRFHATIIAYLVAKLSHYPI